jgi:hypothetical protein
MSGTRQHARNEHQNATGKMAEETTRTARTMADIGEQTVRASADLVQRNAAALQQAWQSGSELATRSTEQFARALGITGKEAQKARQQSLRDLEAIGQSNNTLVEAVQKISLECFEFASKRMAQNLDWFDALMRCRTPQELTTVQSDFARDNLDDLLQTIRRMAEISIQTADQEVRNVTETLALVPGEGPAERWPARQAAARQATARRTGKSSRTTRDAR